MAITYVFPGQGSQKKGMGQNVFKHYSHLVEQANAVLGYSIEKICLEASEQVLAQTKYTQAAIYVVNTLLYLEDTKRRERYPDYVAGHSIGEFNALFAAGVFDFVTGLELVQQRANLMSATSAGTMCVVLGLSASQVSNLLEAADLHMIDVAAWNAPEQVVLAGTQEALSTATPLFLSKGALKVHPLSVSGAFHSRFMQPAATQFEALLKGYQLSTPKIPVLSNYTAQPHQSENIKSNLSQQLCRPVRWLESIEYVLKKDAETTFVEVSCHPVLTRLIEQIKAASRQDHSLISQ